MTSAAEAGVKDNPFIAAVNRCATQSKDKDESFSKL
jgi:hypothetical protein